MINPIISGTVERHGAELKRLSLKIHKCPELGLEEFNACKWQTELLKRMGFEVRSPYCGLRTAYFAKSGKGDPVFCFLAEYDALPEMGHACGHNLICSAAIGAGKALAETLKKEKIPGTVIVMGTPAEEGKGGKVQLLSKNGFDNIDAVIMAHPLYRTQPWHGFLSVERFNVSFHGKSSHAANSPDKGRNALDAAMLLFQGINAWRQHLPESSRIHGIITSGGAAPNIIPDFSSCGFYLRAEKETGMKEMIRRFRDIAKGAALMTGTSCEIKNGGEGYKSGKINKTLNDEYFRVTEELGMNPVMTERGGRASSDFGDVSQLIPGTHVYFGISPKEKPPLHSAKFAEAAKSDYALNTMLKASKAMAQIGYRFFTDPDFRKGIREDFRKNP
ncbi:MAG: M20 family metallopeptidase [Victivallales bacterium]